MKKIHLKLWRDIRAQKWQFLALVVIILLGVTTYSGMVGAIDDVIVSLERTLEKLAFQDFIVTFADNVPQSVVAEVAALDNVRAATGRSVVDVGLYISDDNQIHARLIGMPPEAQPPVNRLYIQEGRYLQRGDDLVAVLDHHLAEYYGFGPGTVLHPIVNGRKLDVEVVGVAVSPEYLMAVASAENILPSPGGFAVLFMPQETVQRLMGAEGTVNELNIGLVDNAPEQVEATIAQVKAALDEYPLGTIVRRADNPSYKLLLMDLEGGQEMIGMIPTMFLIIAAMSIYVFLSRMVQAQRPQIGVLKALGYSRWAVMRYYLLFAGAMALLGAVLGLALSVPLGRGFAQAYAAEFGLPFVVTHFHPDAAVQAIALNLFICLLAAFFPARTSAQMAPAQAIRFDPSLAPVKGSIPWPERLLGRFLALRTETKIALRNLGRNRRRTLTTGLGFVFAIVVLLVCWAMFDGMDHMLDIQFRETDRWDLQVLFNRPQPPAVMEEVQGWDGVAAVEPILVMPVTIRADGGSKDTFLVALDPETELHGFQLPRDKTPEDALRPGHLLIGPQMGDDLGVQSGDTVTLETPLGEREAVVETDNKEVMSAGAYVSLDWAQEQIPGGLELLNGLWLRVDEAHRAEVKKKLYHLPGVASVERKEEVAAGWQALMGLYYVMMGMFLLFALIMAGAVIFNTMTVNILERQREIATMRALGQRRNRLRWMITLENLLIGLVALLPGLVLGSAATYYFFRVFTASADFYLPFYIAPGSYLIVTLLIFGTALLSQLPAMRRVNRMNLAEATKVMT